MTEKKANFFTGKDLCKVREVLSPEQAMKRALQLAWDAGEAGEVPVGAVILDAEGRLCAAQANQVESDSDPSAHAELRAMRAAARHCGTKYLTGCTLYVTLEPCPMCAASMVHFKLGRLVFGAYDPKGGGVEHGPRIFEQKNCLHRPEVIGGIRAEESATLLTEFFSRLRTKKGAEKP